MLFVVDGQATLTVEGKSHLLSAGGYAYLPPGCKWTLTNKAEGAAALPLDPQALRGCRGHRHPPKSFVANEQDEPIVWMPDTERPLGHDALRRSHRPAHDMHVNIVTLEPGAVIPFEETHVMEHGLYVLEGKAVYRLNRDWVEVEAGDFMWLRAFCPQACYAGPERFRYLLYKDVNRHPKLRL